MALAERQEAPAMIRVFVRFSPRFLEHLSPAHTQGPSSLLQRTSLLHPHAPPTRPHALHDRDPMNGHLNSRAPFSTSLLRSSVSLFRYIYISLCLSAPLHRRLFGFPS